MDSNQLSIIQNKQKETPQLNTEGFLHFNYLNHSGIRYQLVQTKLHIISYNKK